jgi:hypothetical protein
VTGRLAAGCALAAALACAPALERGPPAPLPAPAGGAGRPAAELLREARAAFARRPDAAAVAEAAELFRAAAAADPAATEGVEGAVHAELWLARHRRDGAAERAAAAVRLGQECLRRAPDAAGCDYALALALGVQARERPGTVREGLELMVEHLRRAASRQPALDDAGPHRVLAILRLRAPAWPLGPGDPEEGLAEARRAVALAPDFPPNQLALAEALAAGGDGEAGREAARRALALAERRAAAGDPDAPGWAEEARAALAAPPPPAS